MPKVSVIIVNYNGKDLITSCLKALEEQVFRDFEVVVVDNASSDSSLHEIQKFVESSTLAPLIKLIPLSKNSGFSGGNLVGLKYAEGEYIALLNNDAVPDKKWIEEFVKAMNSDPTVGICASKIIVYGTDIIDSAGDGFSSFLKGFKRGEGEKALLYDKSSYIFGACAGAAFYRRKMLEETGFFDEDFFLIQEDTDLNFRAQLAGWKVLYVPAAIVHHKVRSSIGHMSNMAVFYTLRNTEFVIIKNVPFFVILRRLPGYIVRTMTDFIYFALKHKHLRVYFKAKIDVLRMLPKMLKKRKYIIKNKKVKNSYLLSIITAIWQRDFLMAKIKKLLYG